APNSPTQTLNPAPGTTCGTNGTGTSTDDHNGNIGSANGPPAFCGHLTMYFDRNHKKTFSQIYGNRTVTRGKLISCERHPRPVVGAKIDVIHVLHGVRHLIKTGLKSRPGGKLTLILPLNLTTRTIEYDYRGH